MERQLSFRVEGRSLTFYLKEVRSSLREVHLKDQRASGNMYRDKETLRNSQRKILNKGRRGEKQERNRKTEAESDRTEEAAVAGH